MGAAAPTLPKEKAPEVLAGAGFEDKPVEKLAAEKAEKAVALFPALFAALFPAFAG